jgi:ppGpp synthetase/RelA/SpoT-type nucleotidyltranferase
MNEDYTTEIDDANNPCYLSRDPQNRVISLSLRIKSLQRLASKILSYETLTDDIEQRVRTEGKQIRFQMDDTNRTRTTYIQDVYGVRMIIDDSRDWDYIYGIVIPFIENNFQLLDGNSYRTNGRFAGKPKRNGYESEHLNVVHSFPGLNNPIVIELQIRDKKADYVATQGSAAKYHDLRTLKQFFK